MATIERKRSSDGINPFAEDSEDIFILGTRVSSAKSYESIYQAVVQAARHHPASVYLTINNVHTLVEAVRQPVFRVIIEKSFLSIPDGRPLSIIGRTKGAKNMQRIFGPTLFEKTLEWGQRDGLRHFFFGNSRDTVEKMIAVIKQRYPRAIIAGLILPPYRPFTDEENAQYLATMREADPDIIWVSLGAPKQEYWIYQHYQQLDRGVFIGIGAGFSYLSGKIKHAPHWMKIFALEWLYRLIQEPFRLFRRYLVSNTLFIYFFLCECFHLKKFPGTENCHQR